MRAIIIGSVAALVIGGAAVGTKISGDQVAKVLERSD